MRAAIDLDLAKHGSQVQGADGHGRFVNGRPAVTLGEIGAKLLRMRIAPPGEGDAWAPASVQALLDRVRAMGLLREGTGPKRRPRRRAMAWNSTVLLAAS